MSSNINVSDCFLTFLDDDLLGSKGKNFIIFGSDVTEAGQ